MSTLDITRHAFDERKHYSGVRMQQGRVLADDDWNEHQRIVREAGRLATLDVIGSHGSSDEGFRVESPRVDAQGRIDFDIRAGTAYVGGIRVDLDQPETYRLQSDWVNQPHSLDPAPNGDRIDLVYIEVWEQPVTAVEDSELFEAALGGADTSGRVKVMRRVRVMPDLQTDVCGEAWARARERWKNDGLGVIGDDHELRSNAQLTVSYEAGVVEGNLCDPAVAGGYLGAENQSIHVRLVDGGHLVWSNHNASSLYRVQVTGDNVQMLTQPKDATLWPQQNHLVEILPWSARLPNGEKVAELSGHFSRVRRAFDPDTSTLEIEIPLPASFPGEEWTNRPDSAAIGDPAEAFYFMRVWEQDRAIAQPFLDVAGGGPVTLGNTGISVSISEEPSVNTGQPQYLENDHWIIAARPETPSTVVPWSLEAGRRPHGVRRFRAPLALIDWRPSGAVAHDCRVRFNPLTRIHRCCTLHVGDGVHSHGDFNDLREALGALPDRGGKICVLPGIHRANLLIDQRENLTIEGWRGLSLVLPDDSDLSAPLITIRNSRNVEIRDLDLISLDGGCIETTQVAGGETSGIVLRGLRAAGCEFGFRVRGTVVDIVENEVQIFDKDAGGEALAVGGEEIQVEGNRIGVRPTEVKEDEPPPASDGTPDPLDPCAESEIVYLDYPLLWRLLKFWTHIAGSLVLAPQGHFRAKGGISIAAGARRVTVRQNTVAGGSGAGIGFATVVEDEPRPEVSLSYVQDDRLVTGQVRAVHGAGLPGVQVSLQPPSGIAVAIVSDAEGRFQVVGSPQLYQQEVKVAAQLVGYEAVALSYERRGDPALIITMAPIEQTGGSDAVTRDVTISDNSISDMDGDGIGSHWDAGLVGYRAVAVHSLEVRGNHIKRCARAIDDGSGRGRSEVIGHGGISLGLVNDCQIVHNVIVENGTNDDRGICGVFAHWAGGFTAEHNIIRDNGRLIGLEERFLRPAGGVVINSAGPPLVGKHSWSLTELAAELGAALEWTARLGESVHPALRMTGNEVVAAAGRALSVVGVGRMMIENNYFASRSGPDWRTGAAAGEMLLAELDRLVSEQGAGWADLWQRWRTLESPKLHAAVSCVLVLNVGGPAPEDGR